MKGGSIQLKYNTFQILRFWWDTWGWNCITMWGWPSDARFCYALLSRLRRSCLGSSYLQYQPISWVNFPTPHLQNLASEAQPCFVEDVVIQWLTAHQRRRFQSNTIGMSYVDDPLFDQRFMTPSLHMWAISKGAQQRCNVKCHHSLS